MINEKKTFGPSITLLGILYYPGPGKSVDAERGLLYALPIP
jgi:hypothetical protein